MAEAGRRLSGASTSLSSGTFFFTLVTGLRRSLSLNLRDTKVYEPSIRARLGTTAHFCRVVVLKLRASGVANEKASVGGKEEAVWRLDFTLVW